MSSVSLNDARVHFSELIEEVRNGGEVVITEHDQPVARLVAARARPQFGSARGLIEMAEDFDAPLDDMQEYMN